MPILLKSLISLLIVIFTAKSNAEPANFSQPYHRATNPNGDLSVFKYSFQSSRVVRVWLQSENATTNRPLMAAFREKRSIVSIQLPAILQKSHRYNSLARIICPFVGNRTGQGIEDDDVDDSLSVEISCASSTPVEYTLNATLLDNFALTIGQQFNLTASPSEPAFVRFRTEEKLDSVLVMVDANDDLCMTVTIQSVEECPVFNMESNIFFSGIRQTMTRKAFIPVHRRKLKEFYVVFIVTPDDHECSNNNLQTMNETTDGQSINRVKQFSVTVEALPKDTYYWLPLGVTVAVLLFVFILSIIYTSAVMAVDRMEWAKCGKDIVTAAVRQTNYHATAEQHGEEHAFQFNVVVPQSSNKPQTNENDDDVVVTAAEKETARTKVHPTVCDLALKPFKQCEKKYYLYAWNLLTIAMFYGLPVVQLVLVWQNTVSLSGDMDLCYFNFRCARPFLAIFAFNSVISNIGYVALGILFIIMVKEREIRHRRTVGSIVKDDETKFGIPMHNGLLYALGIAITMQGVMSACYHICPSSRNYQFDTAFMYIIGALGMLKIYQLRHPDINPNAHVGYAIMALFIFLAMCGVYFNSLPFYAVFAACYIVIMIAINFEIYFNTQWSLDCGLFSRMRNTYRDVFTNCPTGCIPIYKGRFLFLVIADVINLAFVIAGVVVMPKNFPSFLLLPFVGNLSLYMAYYLFMKKMNHERVRWRTMFYIFSAFVCWCAAMWFFIHGVSDWSEMPAASRVMNRDCILFEFYDNHDVWHFLSALSLFFSFSIFLDLDDDLKWVRRDKIPAF